MPVGAVVLLAGCGDASSTATEPGAGPEMSLPPTSKPAGSTGTSGTLPLGIDPADLITECEREGALNLIAIPDEWANYKGVLASFKAKYPSINVTIQMPVASSAQEEQAVIEQKGKPTQPDVVDVSPPIASSMSTAGLFAQFIPNAANELPAGLRDAGNQWNSAYYGIMAISTNTTVVKNPPRSFADLLKPEYKGQVAILGDPRQSGSAFAAVMAASLANGGSADNIKPGIDFFARLKKAGNLSDVTLTPASVLSGDTPIAVDWSFNVPALKAQMEAAGLTVASHFPTDGIYGGMYAQAVIADSPHPMCGRLWIEHLLSDDGANEFLSGGAIPGRFEAMSDAGNIDAKDAEILPPDALIARVELLSTAQADKAADVLDRYWEELVLNQ